MRAAMGRRGRALEHLAERLLCVPRFLEAINARRGRPLGGHDLEDLAQDVLLRILTKLGSYSGHVLLECWAHRFCFLEFMNVLRVRRPTAVRAGGAWPSRAPRPDPLEAGEDLEALESALVRIDPRLASAIRLHAFDALEFGAMGEHLGIPSATAKSRYYHGLTELRRLLQRDAAGR